MEFWIRNSTRPINQLNIQQKNRIMKTGITTFVLLLLVLGLFGQQTREEFIRLEHEARKRFIEVQQQSFEDFRRGIITQPRQRCRQTIEAPLSISQVECNKMQQPQPASSNHAQCVAPTTTNSGLIPVINRYVGRTATGRMFVSGFRVTSGFGMRRLPHERVARMHQGIDLQTPISTPVIAPFCGKIVNVRNTRRGGVTLRFVSTGAEKDVELLLMHLQSVPRLGKVSRNEVLAYTGNTGVMTNGRRVGAHLHLEMRKNGQVVDPLLYIIASPYPSSNVGKFRLAVKETSMASAQ